MTTRGGAGLRELEKRLGDEPENLGLRVMVAGAMHDAGRKADAVELYRSVAIAYRDQGRAQQAIAVCRSILEIAPEDDRCRALLASLSPRPETAPPPRAEGSQPPIERARRPETSRTGPVRRSSLDDTPLPGPLPYHVADPTTRSVRKLSQADLPVAEGADTRPGGSGTPPPMDGIANAARRISAELIRSSSESYDALDISAELETRQRPRIEDDELEKITRPPPTAPVPRVDPLLGGSAASEADPARDTQRDLADPSDTEEELTVPRDAFAIAATTVRGVPGPTSARAALLQSSFFAPLPPAHRGAVLDRFAARAARVGEVIIRRGQVDAGLVIVGHGRLEIRGERAGQLVLVESVGAGDYVGEGALLTRTPTATQVIAATDADLLVLAPHDFHELAGAYPALWSQLEDVAERRARALSEKLR